MNCFLDIGSHTGEALEEALRPIYKIDSVYAVEPSTFGLNKLMKFKDNRVRIFPIALSNYSSTTKLFGAGSVGGGLFADKNQHWSNTETVQVEKFSAWAEENLAHFTEVYVKINVEGSEFFILQEMLKVHKKIKFKSVLLSIDILKVPSLRGFKYELDCLISSFPVNIVIRETKDVNLSIERWFASLELKLISKSLRVMISDFFRIYLPINRNFLRVLKPYFPKKIWIKIALRFGPNRAR